MLAHPQDAEDATQEVLIKALTRLSSFEGRSTFRTWLYRIVVNHVLNMKRGRLEPETLTFGCYAHGLDNTPDLDPPDEASVPVDVRLVVDEARISCTRACCSASTARSGWFTSSARSWRSPMPSGPSCWRSAATTSASASRGRAAISTVS